MSQNHSETATPRERELAEEELSQIQGGRLIDFIQDLLKQPARAWVVIGDRPHDTWKRVPGFFMGV